MKIAPQSNRCFHFRTALYCICECITSNHVILLVLLFLMYLFCPPDSVRLCTCMVWCWWWLTARLRGSSGRGCWFPTTDTGGSSTSKSSFYFCLPVDHSNGSSVSLHRGCFALQFVQAEENCPHCQSLHLSELTLKAVMWCFFCACPHEFRDLSSRREYGSVRGLCTHREGPNDWKTILNLQTTPLVLVLRQLFCPGACQSVVNNNIYNTFSIEFLRFAVYTVCSHLLFNY